MTGYSLMKMKRKDLEEVYDDFSEFSLSSPARKIRRLDAELPPIIEEEEIGAPLDVDPLPQEEPVEVSETVPSVNLNEERSLVLYKPIGSPVVVSPSSSSPNVSYTVSSELIQGFKNKGFWSDQNNLLESVVNEEDSSNKNDSRNVCLAVVPWVSQQFPTATDFDSSVTEVSEPMDIEEDGPSEEQALKTGGGLGEVDALQRWQQQQQQHCLSPQLPQNTATPVMWS